MEKLSQSIVDFICRNMQVDDDMADVYKYGIEVLISSLVNLLLILISGLLLGDIIAGLVFMIMFILLRSYTGGYHAETYLRCNIAFVCTFVVTFFAARYISTVDNGIVLTVGLLVLSYIPIWLFSPVKNRHKYLSVEKKKRSRIISFVLFFMSVIAAMLLFKNGIWYGYLLAATDVSISMLILIEVFMQKKGYHPSGE